MEHVHLVVNPVARKGRSLKTAGKVEGLMKASGHSVSVVVPDAADDIGPALDRSGHPVERIVGLGGDGLVHAVAGNAVERNVPLGIVASGTGNDFGRAFGLPTKTKAAVEAALSEPTPVDLLRIGDRYVASVATAGFSADVNERANAMSFPPGQSKYSVATMLELRRMSAFSVTIEVDGNVQTLEVSMIAIANTAYFGGGMKVAPAASATDGLLNLMTVGPITPLQMLMFLPTTFWGGHQKHKAVTMSTAEKLAVRLPDDVRLWGDGEPLDKGPFSVSIEPGCLLLAGAR